MPVICDCSWCLLRDEIDALATSRSAGMEGGSHEGVLISLLNEMDGVEELVGVTVIGAMSLCVPKPLPALSCYQEAAFLTMQKDLNASFVSSEILLMRTNCH